MAWNKKAATWGLSALFILLGACTKEPRITEYGLTQSGSAPTKLTQLKGTARPGWPVFVQYRQRRFGPQSIDLGTRWGDPILDDQWKNLGPAILTDKNGNWSMTPGGGTTVSMVPSAPVSPPNSTQNGLFTEFRLTALNPENLVWTAHPPPTLLNGMNVYNTGGANPQVQSEARIEDFEFAALAALDGPTDCDAPAESCPPSSTLDDMDTVLQTFDKLQDYEVAWAATDWNAFDTIFPLFPPHIAVASPGGIAGNPNPEYPFLLGVVQASRPGYAFIATAVAERPTTPSFTVGVTGKIKVKVKVGICWIFC